MESTILNRSVFSDGVEAVPVVLVKAWPSRVEGETFNQGYAGVREARPWGTP
jgi:hypothetical protein